MAEHLAALASPPPPPPDTLDRKALVKRLESYYDFQCEGGPLKNCVEWQELKRRISGVSQHDDLVARLRAVAEREDPVPIEPFESDAVLEDVPEITIEERREIVGLMREAASALARLRAPTPTGEQK